jgi:pilus assembly protein CpaE
VKLLSFLIVSPRDLFGAGLQQMKDVEVAERLSEPAGLFEAVGRSRPDVVLMDASEDPIVCLEQFEKVPEPRPPLLIAGLHEDAGLMLRANWLGAKQFLPAHPSQADLRSAIDQMLLDRKPAEPGSRTGSMITVLGAKGGVGGSFVACQLGAELARLGARVAIVDLNLQVGDVALYFKLTPRHTLADVASDPERLTAARLDAVLEEHSSGVHVLAAPARLEESAFVEPRHVEEALTLLRDRFEWVIVDASRIWDETTVSLLDQADQIFLVTLMDEATLHHARQQLDMIERMGHSTEKIQLIANRYSKKAPIKRGDFTKFLERKPDLVIPNDYLSTVRCVREGKPLWQVARQTLLRRVFARMAIRTHEWCGAEPPTAPALDNRSVLQRLIGRPKSAAD